MKIFFILLLIPLFLILYPKSVCEDKNFKTDTHVQMLNLKCKSRIFAYLNKIAPHLNSKHKQQLVQLIYSEAQDQKIDPQLITALIKVESDFRYNVHSKVGARGLMQIRFATAKEIADELNLTLNDAESLYEPYLNIKIGTHYLVKMIKRFKDLELALAAYNIGPTAVRELINNKKSIPDRYSKKVFRNYQLIQQTDV
jgi:soluble lytic murein transglycosylase